MPQRRLDTGDKTVGLTFRIPSRLDTAAKKLAKAENKTVSQVVREALDGYLDTAEV